MTDLRTPKGEPIIYVPIRSEINAKNRRELIRKIRDLKDSLSNDEMFYSIHKVSDDVYEVSLKNTQGFLLAESIQRHFNYPRNLIWCEKLSGGTEQVLIVVICEGRIQLDAIIPLTAVEADIGDAIGESSGYEIYVHGDTPLVESAGEDEYDKVSLVPERVKSFTTLERSLLNFIEWHPGDRTKGLSKAVSDAGLGNSAPLLIGLAIVAIAGAYYLMDNKEEPVRTVIVDRYNDYKSALNDAVPAELLLAEFIDRVAIVNQLKTWTIETAGTNGAQFDFVLKPSDDVVDGLSDQSMGNYSEVRSLAKALNSKVVNQQNKFYLSDSRVTGFNSRVVNQIVDVNSVVEHIFKEAKEKSLSFELVGLTEFPSYVVQESRLEGKNLSIYELFSWIEIIGGLPVTLTAFELKPNGDSYSAEMRFNIYGKSE